MRIADYAPAVTSPRPDRIEPAPGQESVWDYPRPPRVERSPRRARVQLADVVVADTRQALRVLETASPPTFYLPRGDVRVDLLVPTTHTTWCEWKGRAEYYDLRVGERVVRHAAWSYPDPHAPFAVLRDHFAFYPGRVDACFLDDEPVRAQAGGFYGGWITHDVVGPFKGEPGTFGW